MSEPRSAFRLHGDLARSDLQMSLFRASGAHILKNAALRVSQKHYVRVTPNQISTQPLATLRRFFLPRINGRPAGFQAAGPSVELSCARRGHPAERDRLSVR